MIKTLIFKIQGTTENNTTINMENQLLYTNNDYQNNTILENQQAAPVNMENNSQLNIATLQN